MMLIKTEANLKDSGLMCYYHLILMNNFSNKTRVLDWLYY